MLVSIAVLIRDDLLVIASHIVNPGFDPVFAAGKRDRGFQLTFQMGFGSPRAGRITGAVFLDDKLDAVAGSDAERFRISLRNRHLSLGN